ncbi:MAG: aromatic-ring-hydroxylating dioxygenase subunit beta [Burkholderiaceae bacterium]|nr:aromatic-ring-hydroxylating dioxygenase subunit beta [Burkholderiaceae bacterium]
MLDERRWHEWLELFTEDCEFWVPTWLDEGQLASNPGSQLSLIYYSSRAPLEDRILRIESGRSPASTPLRRTSHHLSNLLVEAASDSEILVRSASTCMIYDPHTTRIETLSGWTRHTLRLVDGAWRIARKKVVIINDVLPPVVDFYLI